MEASIINSQSLESAGQEKHHGAVKQGHRSESTFTCPDSSNEEHMPTEEIGHSANANANVTVIERLERGYMQYGCSHYRRRCRIRAPCCNEVFDCRHCHNEAKVHQFCINCGVCMGKFFCETCKLFDDDLSKKQYHCNGCGICRIGGRENFFHCFKCGCCYSILLKQSHPCVERALHHDCPVCFEYLFESTDEVIVLPCGHTIHMNCLKEMRQHLQYACPLCSKSVCDMSKVWEKLDTEIAATPMPESYQNKMVWILCNDCGGTSQVKFHVVAQKCLNCKSYNTRQTRDRVATSSCSED